MAKRAGLKALRSMIAEAELILTTTTLPQGRAQRVCELLGTAVKLMKAIDPDYYRKIAAMRKTKAGGRPKVEQK